MHVSASPPDDVYADCVVSTFYEVEEPESYYTGVITYTGTSLPSSLAYREDVAGSLIWIDNWIYSDSGRLLRQERDRSGDGSLDRVWTWGYDTFGRQTRWSDDQGADGRADSERHFEYNDFGDLLVEWSDSDADGVADDTRHHTYDAYGRRVRESYDRNGDGSVDTILRRIWSGHLLVQVELDSDADGTPDYSHKYLYDSVDRIVRTESTHIESGTLYQFRTYGYENHGWLTSAELYRPQLEGATYYDYDTHGRLTETRLPFELEKRTHSNRCPGLLLATHVSPVDYQPRDCLTNRCARLEWSSPSLHGVDPSELVAARAARHGSAEGAHVSRSMLAQPTLSQLSLLAVRPPMSKSPYRRR